MFKMFGRLLILLLLITFNTAALAAETTKKEDEALPLRYEQAHMAVKNKNYNEAFASFSKLADEGHPAAQHIVGMMYEKGIGCKRNLPKAVGYYRKAADQDFCDAQCRLGHMYLAGNSVLYKNTEQATQWLAKAAAKGQPAAEYTLGMLHLKGDTIPKDLDKAGQYLRSAASHGVQEAEEAVAKLPPLPYTKPKLGAPGQAYGQGVQNIKDSWSGYGDLVKSLQSVNNR